MRRRRRIDRHAADRIDGRRRGAVRGRRMLQGLVHVKSLETDTR
jgi:hypothetical protein